MVLATHLPEDVLHTTARGASAARATPDRSAMLHCPMCGAAMKRTHVAASQIEIDVCGCGTFYDKDEISALAEGIRRTRWSPAGGAALAGAAVGGAALVGAGALGAAAVGGAAMGVAAMDEEHRDDALELATNVADVGLDVGGEIVGSGGAEAAAEVGGAVLEGAGEVAEAGGSLLGGVFDILGGLFGGL
jgi:hypothetical protein